VRKPGKPLTAGELAARRANLEKAIVARRGPKGNAAARLNAFKHGLFAKQTLVESTDRLGENKEEFDLHLRFFERVFVPADQEEKQIVRGLAQTVWRRHPR
jgi:hypothetical protein